MRFAPELEAEFSRAHLNHSRMLIRVVCLLGALLTAIAGLQALILKSLAPATLVGALAVFIMSAGMAWLAWSDAFERLFLPWAQVLVPARNGLAALLIGYAVSQGQTVEIMHMPLMIIGPFFFMGFRFRIAFVASAIALSAFTISAYTFDVSLTILTRSVIFLSVTGVACAVAAYGFERRLRQSFLESRVIADMAEHDALTGLKNRRVFDEYLTRLWQQAIEDRRTLVLMLIDVDHFKAYNDRYGHQAGDQTLFRVAQTVQRFTHRPLDVMARYGGEEFAAILFDVDARQARNIAEQMRTAVEGLGIEHRGSRTSTTVSISVGVAIVEPTASRKPLGALQLADEALYDAKARGRNRIVLKDDAEYSGLVTGTFARIRP